MYGFTGCCGGFGFWWGLIFGSGSLVDFWTVSAWRRWQIFCGVALIWRDRPDVAAERFRWSRPLNGFIEKL